MKLIYQTKKGYYYRSSRSLLQIFIFTLSSHSCINSNVIEIVDIYIHIDKIDLSRIILYSKVKTN